MTTERHDPASTVTPGEYYAGSGKPHRNGGFFMSTPGQTRHIKEPIAGRWAWREYGPSCKCDLDDLRARAMATKPDGVDVFRFLAWVEAEFTGQDIIGAPRGTAALAKYRRFLFELNVDHEPAHGLEDVHLQQQRQCAFGGVTETAENPCSLGSVKLVAA